MEGKKLILLTSLTHSLSCSNDRLQKCVNDLFFGLCTARGGYWSNSTVGPYVECVNHSPRARRAPPRAPANTELLLVRDVA